MDDAPMPVFGSPTPNPTHDEVTFRVTASSSPGASGGEISILDVTGRVVRTLPLTRLGSKGYTATWDLKTSRGSRVHEGLYFARYTVGTRTYAHRLVVE